MRTIAVIPARGGSKRLPRKNLRELFGKPILEWAIEACERSRKIEGVFVSTEDSEITRIVERTSAGVIRRPASLSGDDVPKMKVIRHAHKWYLENFPGELDIIVSVQANSPEIKSSHIDQGIDLLLNNDLWEVIAVGPDNIQNASFRVISVGCLYNDYLSANMGVVHNNCVDVHWQEDLDFIREKYGCRDSFVKAVIS